VADIKTRPGRHAAPACSAGTHAAPRAVLQPSGDRGAVTAAGLYVSGDTSSIVDRGGASISSSSSRRISEQQSAR